MRSKKDIQRILDKPIAHRGFHDDHIPENSLTAINKAVEAQHPVEIDIRITKDNQIVVFHDKDLLRLCGSNKKIKKLTHSQLSHFSLVQTKEKIPLLSEVLNLVRSQVPLIIEIKDSKNPVIRTELLNILSNYQGIIAIHSFNPLLLRWFKIKAPHLLRGQIAGKLPHIKINKLFKKIFLSYKFNAISQPDFICHDWQDHQNPILPRLKTKGIPILFWNMTNPEEITLAQEEGDNIFLENIDQ